MNPSTLVAKLGSSSAVLFILFLPLIGCQGEEFTGVDILSHKDMWVEVKVFLVIAMVCGGLILLLQNRMHIGLTAIVAVAALATAFFIATSKNDMFQLRNGAYFALVGFLVTVVLSFITQPEQKAHPD